MEKYGNNMTRAQAHLHISGPRKNMGDFWGSVVITILLLAVYTVGFEMGLRSDDGASLVRSFLP
jgi:hypothetical protein